MTILVLTASGSQWNAMKLIHVRMSAEVHNAAVNESSN
jgi:hypothetical protein